MISISNFHLRNLLKKSKSKNLNPHLKNFKNFSLYQKYINNDHIDTPVQKESTPIQKQNEISNTNSGLISKSETKDELIIEDVNQKLSVEFSKNLSALKDQLYGPHIQHKNFEMIYTHIMEILSTYQKSKDTKTYDLIFDEILPFLERHIQRFKVEQMIKIVCSLADNNIGHLQYFRIFQYYIGKALEKEKNHFSLSREDPKFTKLLFQYFSLTSEISMMERGPLNFLLDYFANYSSSLLNKNSEAQTLYDFLWLTSISISSILIKNTSCSEFEPYVDTKAKVLQDKGALALKKILNHLEGVVKADKNLSENLVGKVRLYKALYYLKLEGLELGNNLNEFLIKFAPFHKMNMERAVSGSVLENNFENILKKLDLKYEKERKLDFCSVDFFIEPDFCIEINGPTHYVFTNRPKNLEENATHEFPIGKDLLKRRVLQLERYDYLEFNYNELINNPGGVLETLQTRYGHLKDEKYLNELNVLKKERQIYIGEKKQDAKKKNIVQRVKDSHYLI